MAIVGGRAECLLALLEWHGAERVAAVQVACKSRDKLIERVRCTLFGCESGSA